jgi:hypothetical protein
MGILLVVIFVDSLIFAAKNFKHVRACPTPRGIIALYFPGYNKQRPLTALTTCGRALLEDQRFLSIEECVYGLRFLTQFSPIDVY